MNRNGYPLPRIASRGEGWGGMPDLNGQGLNWTRLHDHYQQPAAHACCSVNES